jgi:Flp pilus assembly protein TadD
MELAGAYILSGFPDMAVEHYRAAASRFPESAEVVIQLAKTLRIMQLPDESKATLEQFIARSADPSPEVLSWLGILQDQAGEYALAEKSYRAALEKQPGSDLLHNNLGYNLLLQGRNQEAAAEFRRALEIAPGSVLARNNLGLALASDPQDAMLSRQSVDDRASAHNNLAAMLIEKGNYADARRQLELALGYKNDHQAALKNLDIVSELDGGATALSWPLANAFWRRFLYILIGDNPPKSVGGTVNSASQ